MLENNIMQLDVSSNKLTVLMIDDEHICLELIQLLLSKARYEVITAGSGIEGLQHLLTYKGNIHAILLDMMMPDMHGLEVLQEIKKHQHLAHIPVIIQSGIAGEGDLQKALELGAVCYVRKPYKKADINNAIEKALEYSKTCAV